MGGFAVITLDFPPTPGSMVALSGARTLPPRLPDLCVLSVKLSISLHTTGRSMKSHGGVGGLEESQIDYAAEKRRGERTQNHYVADCTSARIAAGALSVCKPTTLEQALKRFHGDSRHYLMSFSLQLSHTLALPPLSSTHFDPC